jgi:hypothetical protein
MKGGIELDKLAPQLVEQLSSDDLLCRASSNVRRGSVHTISLVWLNRTARYRTRSYARIRGLVVVNHPVRY